MRPPVRASSALFCSLLCLRMLRPMTQAIGNHKRYCCISNVSISGGNDDLSSQLFSCFMSDRALNLLGGVLDAKRESETHLRQSTLAWTVVRPGVFAKRAAWLCHFFYLQRLLVLRLAMSPQGLRGWMVTAEVQGAVQVAQADSLQTASISRASSSAQGTGTCASMFAAGGTAGGAFCAVTREQVCPP